MTVIDDYLQHIDPIQRADLERIRKIVKKIVPTAEEVIGYGMPTFKYKGKAFFGFDLHKNHIGLYPYGGEEIQAMKDKLADFSLSKGAIRVPLDAKFPEDLLTEIITRRIERIEKK